MIEKFNKSVWFGVTLGLMSMGVILPCDGQADYSASCTGCEAGCSGDPTSCYVNCDCCLDNEEKCHQANINYWPETGTDINNCNGVLVQGDCQMPSKNDDVLRKNKIDKRTPPRDF